MQLRAASLAADEYLGPGRDGFLQHGFEVDRGRLVNDRAHARGFVHRIAAGVFLGFLGKPAGELGRDAFLDQNAFHRGAALAGIAEAALRRERDRQVQVGVVEHDERIVAAQFEHQPFVARRSRDAFAHGNAAGEGNELDPRVLDQRLGDFSRRTEQDAQHGTGQTSFVKQFGKPDGRQRRLL